MNYALDDDEEPPIAALPRFTPEEVSADKIMAYLAFRHGFYVTKPFAGVRPKCGWAAVYVGQGVGPIFVASPAVTSEGKAVVGIGIRSLRRHAEEHGVRSVPLHIKLAHCDFAARLRKAAELKAQAWRLANGKMAHASELWNALLDIQGGVGLTIEEFDAQTQTPENYGRLVIEAEKAQRLCERRNYGALISEYGPAFDLCDIKERSELSDDNGY